MIPGLPYDVINHVPFTKFKGLSGSSLYLVNTMEEWKAFFDLMMRKKLVACDTETSGFKYYKGDKIVGMSFGWENDHFYIPVRHADSETGGVQLPQLNMDDLRPDLIKFFSRTDVYTIWANGKFDKHFYKADGIDVKTPSHDTLFLWKFYDEDAPAALKTVASGWTDLMGRKHEGIIGPEANANEKEISVWRADEAKARRTKFNKKVIKKANELGKEMKYQGMNRNQLKKLIRETILNNDPDNAKKDEIHYGYIPIDMMVKYAATDTFLTWRLYEFLLRNLQMSDKLRALYINELQLSTALFDAEEGGVKIDRKYLVTLGDKYNTEIEKLKKSILLQLTDGLPPEEDVPSESPYDEALEESKTWAQKLEEAIESIPEEGEKLNMNSTDQLAEALMRIGVPLIKTTEKGKLCLDKGVLNSFKSDFAVIKDILDMRGMQKLKRTYVDSILEKLVNDDMLHCGYNQNVATGRMSSQDPNLNNIPGRDDSIRRAFISPDDDYIYLFLDYSQVEVRLTAHYSNDPILVQAYKSGQDVHTRSTCEMFGFNYETFSDIIEKEDKTNPLYSEYKQLRGVGKVLNFGIVYSVSGEGLSEQIPRPDKYAHLTKDEWIRQCEKFIEQYLAKYIYVKRFMNEGKRVVRKDAQIENFFGRIRHLPHAHATKILKDKTKYWMEARAERQGVNALIQSTAADMFKMAIVRVHKILKGSKSRMVNFVHDEIQIYLHKDDVHLVPQIKAAMEDFEFRVPIVADVTYSRTNWADKKKFKMEDFQQ